MHGLPLVYLLHVLLPVWLAAECQWTQATLKWLYACVRLRVPYHARFLCKAHRAEVTLERFLAGVDTQVIVQVALLEE